MAVFGNSKTILKTPEVTFSIEMRPFTSMQLEAGKRLFSMLLARAQTRDKEKSSWKK